MVDSHLPRFSQALQAVLLAVAFLIDSSLIVVLLAVLLMAAALGGQRWNMFAHLYRSLPLPGGEPEPAGPPRFAQTLGAVFLTIASIGLLGLDPRSIGWWVIGWGPALAVALLAGLAATTSF
jgi:hypothetical protein